MTVQSYFPCGANKHPPNTCYHGPTRCHIPNNMSTGSAIFAGLTVVTDRQTDRMTDHTTSSVTINLIATMVK